MGVEQVSTIGADLEKLLINVNEPAVVVVFGGVGVGKTTIAKEIAKRMGTVSLTSDEFRRRRFHTIQYQPWHSSQAVWDMIIAATELFKAGRNSVVLDATFSKRKYRENAARLAEKNHKKIIWVEVVSEVPQIKPRNFDGNFITREIDKPVDIAQRIIVNNSVRSGNAEENIKRLVDRFVIS